MKRLVLLILAISTFSFTFAQSEQPPYKQNKNLPAFDIETAGKGVFNTSKLKKNTPVLIMFFSPGCDHCIDQFESMKKRMSELKKYQIVMATYQPLEELAAFDKKYQIAKYPNITTGRDLNYFLPPFFEISNFPHLAFYDRNHKLVYANEGNMSVDNMLKKFK